MEKIMYMVNKWINQGQDMDKPDPFQEIPQDENSCRVIMCSEVAYVLVP